MSQFPIIYSVFIAGQASNDKNGPGGSFAYSKHLDHRKDPNALTVLPATVLESGTTVVDLVTDMVQLQSGLMVAIGDAGNVYQRATNGTWSANATALPDTAYGMVYNIQHDTIYIPGQTALHAVTGADGLYSGSAFTVTANVIAAQVDQSGGTHANSYTTLSFVSEASKDKLTYTPTLEPTNQIKLYIATVGTGAVTVIVHDAANNELGRIQVAAASLTAGAVNTFTFATPLRSYLGSIYHAHVIYDNSASKTASTIGTTTASDFSTAQYEQWANRFVQSANGYHPALEFLQYLCFGNERYLAVWEPISQSAPSKTEFQQHKLTFPSGYNTTSLALWNEFIAIAAEKRSTSNTNEFQNGRIYLWDGTATTYNTIIPVPEGSPNSLFSGANILYWFAGGRWWAYSGGQPVSIFQMPGTDVEYTGASTYIRNYPHAMTMRNNILLAAFPSETNVQTIEHAVYSFGSRDKNSPQSFGNSYSISTGTSLYDGTHALRIGMIKNFGDKTFVSWRDDSQTSKYGVDKIDPTSPPASSYTFESLINDNMFISMKRHFPRTDKDKEIADVIIVTAAALPNDATITPKVKVDRGAWTTPATGEVLTNNAGTVMRWSVNKRFREVQVGFDGTAGTTTPKILFVGYLANQLGEEAD